MSNFSQALCDLTRMPVAHVDPFSHVALAKGATKQGPVGDPSNMTVALGLALGRAA
jgi:Tfp pilus assembly PilM family ATPase